MKTILLIAANDNPRTRYLLPILETGYQVRSLATAAAGIGALESQREEPHALILDNPSGLDRAEELISYVGQYNNALFSVPVLLLTDEAHRDRDEDYLDDTVVGSIEEGQSARVVLQRIDKANEFINSVTFQEFSRMLKVLPSLIYLKDARGRYVFCSQYWHHLEHYDDPDWTIRGKTDLEIRKDQENARLAYESDLRIIATGEGTSYVIEENEDGVQEYLQLIKEPLKNEDGQVQGIIAIINNVTEQERLRQELHRRSFTDELTGLYNRAYFDEYVTQLPETVYPLGILSADCDGLKEINDQWGHAVGDEYIRMAATLLKTSLSPGSIIFRMGGDEYMALLPGTNEEALQRTISRLQENAKIFSIRERSLSVSFGVCLMTSAELSFQACMEQSDRDMYRNKRARKTADQLSRIPKDHQNG